jgi:hypothetical protein
MFVIETATRTDEYFVQRPLVFVFHAFSNQAAMLALR